MTVQFKLAEEEPEEPDEIPEEDAEALDGDGYGGPEESVETGREGAPGRASGAFSDGAAAGSRPDPESFGEETEDDLEFLDGGSFAPEAADGGDLGPGLVGETDENEAEREARFLQEALEELESSGLRWRRKM